MDHDFKQIRRVAFSETDLGGIVHFANYFRYMEDAEHAFYRSLGLPVHYREPAGPGEAGRTEMREIGLPRVCASCDFKAPLRFGDEVEIHLRVREKRPKSITYSFILQKLAGGGGVEVARGSMTAVSVAFDRAAGRMRAVPLPAELARRVREAPEGLPVGEEGETRSS